MPYDSKKARDIGGRISATKRGVPYDPNDPYGWKSQQAEIEKIVEQKRAICVNIRKSIPAERGLVEVKKELYQQLIPFGRPYERRSESLPSFDSRMIQEQHKLNQRNLDVLESMENTYCYGVM